LGHEVAADREDILRPLLGQDVGLLDGHELVGLAMLFEEAQRATVTGPDVEDSRQLVAVAVRDVPRLVLDVCGDDGKHGLRGRVPLEILVSVDDCLEEVHSAPSAAMSPATSG